MVIDEDKPLGRRNKWTKEVYKELEEAEKKEGEVMHFSESWTMRIMIRMNAAIIHKKQVW